MVYRRLINFVMSILLALMSTQGVRASTLNSVGSLPSNLPHHESKNIDEVMALSSNALANDVGARARIGEVHQALDAVDSGRPLPFSNDRYDIFHLVLQSVEIPGHKTIDLSELKTEVQTIPFSNLRVEYHPDKKRLDFVATQGENDLGEHGTVVGRHFIHDLDIVGFAFDQEILSFIDRRGNLSVIDVGYVASQIGKNPIPVFKKVWEPPFPMDLMGKKVKVRYLNRAAEPFPPELLERVDIVIPRNARGEPVLTAGDLIVTYEEGGTPRLLGVFSRAVSHASIVRGSFLLEIQAALADPEFGKIEQLQEVFEKFDEYRVLSEDVYKEDRMNPAVRTALMAIQPAQIEALSGRRADHKKYNSHPRDEFTFEEWKQSFLALQKKAMAEKAQVENRDPHEQRLIEHEYSNENLWKNWTKLVQETPRVDPFPSKKATKHLNLKMLSAVLKGAGVGYLLYPLVHEPLLVQTQIQLLSIFYDNAFPAVLKDATYRVPLLLSMASLVALWPLGEGISMVFGKALKTMDHALQNSQTKFASFVRDLKRNWLELDVWQRITSFGMRFYANFIYPVWVWIPKYVIQQRSLISALQNGLNPLTRISSDSEIGRLLKLPSSEMVGVNSPFLHPQRLSEKTKVKQKIQSLLVVQKRRTEALSWLLGSLVASEKTGVDMATILTFGHRDVSAEQIKKLLSDPATRNEWYIATDMIFKQLWDLKAVGINQDIVNLGPEQIQQAYEISMKVATRLKKMQTGERFLRELNVKFKRFASVSVSRIMNLGIRDAQFLRSIYTDKFVSHQVRREFVPDHLMVVGIYGLYGERADLSQPHNLTADSNGFLWTSRPHLYDIAINTYLHFFVAGSRLALVFQSFKANEADQYRPMEDFEYKSNESVEPFWKSLGTWLSETAKPWKSDIGGIAVKRLHRSITTIQANILQNILFRTIIGGQTIAQAAPAWGMWFFMGQWKYGWPWDIVQAGNKLEEDRINQGVAEDKEARRLMSLGLREPDPARSEELLREANEKMQESYRKNNPRVLKLLDQILSLDQGLDPKAPQAVSRNYYGLVAKVGIAQVKYNQSQSPQDLKELEMLKGKLVQALSGGEVASDPELQRELLRLNGEGLLELSLTHPPHYTKAHPWTADMSSWGGAISTTVMAISLSVASFNPELLNWGYVGKWMMYSTGLYISYYLLLGRRPWEFYFRKIDSVKEYWSRTLAPRIQRAKQNISEARARVPSFSKQKDGEFDEKRNSRSLRCQSVFTLGN